MRCKTAESRRSLQKRKNRQPSGAPVVEARMLRSAIVFAVLAAVPSKAYPCFNGVMIEGDRGVQIVQELEADLEAGRYGDITSTLDGAYIGSPALQLRVSDISMLASLRVSPKRYAQRAIAHFTARVEHLPKSPRHQAWLAEAYAAAGKRELALKILDDLQRRDLMPDGRAYLTLATIVVDNTARDAALDACRKRARLKSICTIRPRQYRSRVRPRHRMRIR